jgi:hypothetical protein
MLFKRNRTPIKHIYYALHLYFFSGLSLRKVSQNLSPFIKMNHISLELDSTALQARKAVT